MIRKIAGLITLALLLGTVACTGKQAEKEKAAIAEAEKWLALVDEGNYVGSWQASAEFFRNAVKQDQWAQAAQSVRKPLGKLLARKVKLASYKTALPGAPDGEYVVITFAASFANKKSATETVTPMRDKDGYWRVSGYYIK